MRPLAVVDAEPGVRERLEVRRRLKEVRVEHLGPIAAIEALDKRILIGFAGLDVMDRHPMPGGPIDERLRQKLGPVVPSECEVKAGQVLL